MKRRIPPSRLVNRNVNASGGRTSLRLETAYWDEISAAAERERVTVSELVRRIELASPGQQRTSAVRVWLLTRLRERAETAERAFSAADAAAVIPPLSAATRPITPNPAGAPDAP